MNALISLFDLAWECSLRGTLLIGLWLLLRPLLRGRVPASLVFAVWVVIGLRLLAPLAIPAKWSPYNVARFWRVSEPVRQGEGLHVEETGERVVRPSPSLIQPLAPVARLVSSVRSQPMETKSLLVIIWAAGLIGLALVRAVSVVVFWRKVNRALQPTDERLMGLTQTVAAELRIGGRVRILTSGAVHAPAVSGWWGPTLLFPVEFSSALGEAELRWVILHELGHWVRRDGWVHALLEWGRIVHWFNPFVWLSAKMARLDCELACDEFVIARAKTQEPADYGAALLKVLGVVRAQPPIGSAVGIFENRKQLKRRIQMIAKYRASTFGRMTSGAVLLALLSWIGVTRETQAQPAKETSASPAPAASTQKSQTPGMAAITQTVPDGWFVNGSHPKSYVVGLDASEVHTAPVSSYIKSIESDIPGFGGMMQSFDAKDYRGKRIRFSAWIKTANVSKSANLWLRIDGTKGSLRFDNIDNRAPKGTRDWQHYSAVLDVPEEAQGIYLGFFVSGTGQAWFNDAKFDVVDSSIQETNMPIPRPRPKQLPVAPQNLSFEAGIPQ